MTYFAELRFAPTQSRRYKTLSEVMPVGEGWAYFVVLSDAYLNTEDGETHIQSFSDLRRALSCSDDLQALQMARTSGKLTEGRHAFPDVVAGYLQQYGAGSASARSWLFGVSDCSTKTIATSELSIAWAGSDVEELEVVDQSAQWYCRMKDVEPLIFLAVRARSLSDQIRHCKEYCREVDGHFEYAR